MIISRSILLRLRNLSDKIVEKIETQIWGPINFFFFSKIVPFMRQCGKILYNRAGHRWQYSAFALHAGYLGIHTHPRNTHSSFHIHCQSCLFPGHTLSKIKISVYSEAASRMKYKRKKWCTSGSNIFPNLRLLIVNNSLTYVMISYKYISHNTDYGVDGPGSNPGRNLILSQPWGLSSLLYNANRVFPGGKVRPGRTAVSRSWKSRLTPLPTLCATPGL